MEKVALSTPVKELGLSVRASNALGRGDIYTLGDILKAKYDGIRKRRCIGPKVAKEIGEKVDLCGYRLEGFAEHEAEESLKVDAVYNVYGYDKDSDVYMNLASFAFYRDAVIMAKTAIKLIHLEMLRNTNGEPFDWVVIENPDGTMETVVE